MPAITMPKKFVIQRWKIPCSEVQCGHLVLKAGVDFVHRGQIIFIPRRFAIDYEILLTVQLSCQRQLHST